VGDSPSLLTCLLQDSVRRSKLDGPLLLQLEGVAKQGTADVVIRIMVQIEESLTAPLRARLARVHFMVDAAVGPVISGSIRVADLFHLTGLEAVQLVALPAEFHIKRPAE
jgi:hypothetical protein